MENNLTPLRAGCGVMAHEITLNGCNYKLSIAKLTEKGDLQIESYKEETSGVSFVNGKIEMISRGGRWYFRRLS